jgi:hypothetical protein
MKELRDIFRSESTENAMKPGDYVNSTMLEYFMDNAGNQTDSLIQLKTVADFIGECPIYDTIVKLNSVTPWVYMGQCFAGEAKNRSVALMEMVYICSRYQAQSPQELDRNIRVAEWAAELTIESGKIPIAPHLYFPRLISDDTSRGRYFGMEAGRRLMKQCSYFHVIVIDGVISDGMKDEIDYMTEVLLLKGIRTNLTESDVNAMTANRMEKQYAGSRG